MPETDRDDEVAATAGSTAPEPAASDARIDLPDVEWKRVSPKFLVVAIVGRVISAVIVCGAAVVLWLLVGWTWAGWALPVLAAAFIIAIAIEPRRVRSIGYALRADDLVFRRGIMFQRFVAVPYGRMQLVDITRGPVSRALGLADLRFVTAAATTGVAIPGLPEADAEELRDQLVTLAESRRAGL
ncbi:PH domain-containing protein [Leifsonia sp. Leaf264]|uniref:PH domain-containing protein n=1 Tax=Leifsonia sp. Leaf264 TaxID=1736314 RepID=UPI0009E8DB0E|nr:PH domain-containing protein [Leifsonia sp. Leaf264]